MEALSLTLDSSALPLEKSLDELIAQLYQRPDNADEDDTGMETGELLGYLAQCDLAEQPALQAIQALTEDIGDPLHPTAQQQALLDWISRVRDHWEKLFPIEQQLRDELRALTPLCAALAVSDPAFRIPGQHPMHQILDALQERAVGWQAQLGRAGEQVQRQVHKVVTQVGSWNETGTIPDLAALAAELQTTFERDASRNARMIQRLVDKEKGRLKATSARHVAAALVNQQAQQWQAPAPVAEFVRGAWFDSLQLVLLKHGADSSEWQQVSDVTVQMLESMQPVAEGDEQQRQRVFEAATKVPKALREWLLSLQHDPDAVTEAVQIIEFSHLRLMKQATLDMVPIQPITIDADSAAPPEGGNSLVALEELVPGQWFEILNEDSGSQRVQLALNLETEQQLLFVNQAGIKALEQTYTQFAGLLSMGRVHQLRCGGSFSLSMLAAVGITSPEDLEEWRDREAREAEAAARREQEEADRKLREAEEAEAARLQQEQQRQAEAAQQQRDEQQAAEAAEREAREQQARAAAERAAAEKNNSDRADAAAQRQATAEAELEQPGETTAASRPEPAAEESSGAEIDLPMGSWLGFHDGETPMMAKLAVHDRSNDNYIFVNREGIKMRDLSRNELLELIDRGQVDIIETRYNFRDAIIRAKQEGNTQ